MNLSLMRPRLRSRTRNDPRRYMKTVERLNSINAPFPTVLMWWIHRGNDDDTAQMLAAHIAETREGARA